MPDRNPTVFFSLAPGFGSASPTDRIRIQIQPTKINADSLKETKYLINLNGLFHEKDWTSQTCTDRSRPN